MNRTAPFICILSLLSAFSGLAQEAPQSSPGVEQAPAQAGPDVTVSFASPLEVEQPPSPRDPFWATAAGGATVAGIVTLVSVIAFVYFSRESLKQKQKEIELANHQKNIEEERRSIYKQLNEFFGPMQQLLTVNGDLVRGFKNGQDFRTVTALLSGVVFHGNDAALLREILNVNEELEKLIMTQSGLVSDEELRAMLSREVSHIRILRMAASNELSAELERFGQYVYPSELEKRIANHIRNLHDRIEKLKDLPGLR